MDYILPIMAIAMVILCFLSMTVPVAMYWIMFLSSFMKQRNFFNEND